MRWTATGSDCSAEYAEENAESWKQDDEVAATPQKYKPSDEELAALDLFGGPIVTPSDTPGTDSKSVTGNVLALMNDPLDLSTSPLKSALDAAFLEDDAAKLVYLKCRNFGIQCINIQDPDYSVEYPEKVLIWTSAPFIPIAKQHLASVETFCRMVLTEELYDKCESDAWEHVTRNGFWHATQNQGGAALHLAQGSLCPCKHLGSLVNKPVGGPACLAPLMIGQIKSGGKNGSRPANGVMIFCYDHLSSGFSSNEGSQNAQRCLRIIPYMMALMQARLQAAGGQPITENLELHREWFGQRPKLLIALMVENMVMQNHMAAKMGEPKPVSKSPAKSLGSGKNLTPSITKWMISTPRSKGKGDAKPIKGKGAFD